MSSKLWWRSWIWNLSSSHCLIWFNTKSSWNQANGGETLIRDMDLDDKVINLDIVIQYLLSSQLSLKCKFLPEVMQYNFDHYDKILSYVTIKIFSCQKSIKESDSIDQNVLFESRENVIYNILWRVKRYKGLCHNTEMWSLSLWGNINVEWCSRDTIS